MKTREFKVDSDTVTVQAEIRDKLLKAIVNGEQIEGPLLRTSRGAGVWKVGGNSYRVVATEHDSRIWAAVNGRVYIFEDARAQDELGVGSANENSVSAPMPGKVIKIFVAEGDEVEEGQPIVIVEAMKMEHVLRAPKQGVVASLDCSEGQQVDPGVPLIEIEESK